MKPATTIFINWKGGTGKTTVCRELGVYVASRGLKVALIDADPQGNLTKSLLPETAAGGAGLYDALDGGALNLHELDRHLHLLAGDFRLSALEKSLVGEIDAFGRMRELFAQEAFQRHSHLFIDTPPSLGVLTGNALAAGDHIIIVMRPALYSMQGTNDLMQTISKVKKTLNPRLNLLGVIINGFDSQPVIVREIRKEIEESFGEKVFSTVLSQTIKLEEAIAERTGVIHMKYLAKSRAKEEVERIGAELLARLAPHLSPSIDGGESKREGVQGKGAGQAGVFSESEASND
jgi:chromosome partitioning protein